MLMQRYLTADDKDLVFFMFTGFGGGGAITTPGSQAYKPGCN
jgi:hypothetical protein